ncbi:MAG TPA: BTAD domain-containing putative transcriptional regulator [Actinomycetota bacterium]|nr:BTAD domain-containing putative transcriptional regulator [Actinomycetota bacterium]
MLRFGLLGPLEVTAWGAPVRLGGAKQRALLAILLLNANKVLSSERLIDLLWEQEPPGTAPTALQVYVSGLRKALEPERARGGAGRILISRTSGYLLAVEPEQLDLLRFERLTLDGRMAVSRADHAASADLFRRALTLWRGPALADFAYAPFAQGEIVRLEELRITVFQERIEADLALGLHQELVGELEAALEAHPLRERLHASRMLALYRSGRQAEALEAYGRSRNLFLEELGIEPSPNLRNLERAILEQAPSLELGSAGPPPGPVAPPVERRRRRKVVTALSFEVTTASPEETESDPEHLGAMMNEVYEKLQVVVERHGGTLRSATGDRITAVFGIPSAHEDDALRAVRSAFEARDAVASMEPGRGTRPHLCIGVNTGEVMTGVSPATGGLPVGTAVNRAAELGLAAEPDEVLIGDDTYYLVSDAVEAEPVEIPSRRTLGSVVSARRALMLKPSTPGRRRRPAAPLVGRGADLALLGQAFDQVAKEKGCYLLAILGPAGIGKSRLLTAVGEELEGRAEIVRTGCLPYGENAGSWPLEQLVQQAARVGEGASEKEVDAALRLLFQSVHEGERAARLLAQMLARLQTSAASEEISWAVRKLLESVAERRPLTVFVDDIHWAEAAFLEVIEHVAEWMRGPLLIVCAGRPDFLDTRPHWSAGKLNASSMTLAPLDEKESRTVLRNLLGAQDLDPEAAESIIDTAQGNPLFVEEIFAMLADRGALGHSEGSRRDVEAQGALSIPPTIQALIGARVDALGREERQVLEQASVVGVTFGETPVVELSVAAVAPQVPDLLAGLVRKDFVREGERPDGDGYAFRHNLVREVVYEAISKQRRADLHESLATWLEKLSERPTEETVAHHLERTFTYRQELGNRSSAQRALGLRAAALLVEVGRRVRRRGDLLGTMSSFQRALKLCPPGDPGRIPVLIELSSCHMDVGDMQPAATLLQEAREQASRLGQVRLEARAAVALWEARSWTNNVAGWREEALAEAARAIEVFEDLSDELGLALTHRLRALVLQDNYQFAAAEEALELALTHARRASDEDEERKILELYASSSLWGPTPVEEGIARLQDLRLRFGDNLLVEAGSLPRLAGFAAMQGRFDEARRLVSRSRALLDELGAGLMAEVTVGAGIVELLAGDWAAAEKELRASYEAFERLGEVNARIVSASYLARALYEQGAYQEAETYVRRAEALTPDDDLAARIEWAPVAAKLLARSGDHAGAIELARAAVALAEGTDEIPAYAAALVDLSEVLEGAGEPAEAPRRLAVELYERKGNVVLAARAAAGLG